MYYIETSVQPSRIQPQMADNQQYQLNPIPIFSRVHGTLQVTVGPSVRPLVHVCRSIRWSHRWFYIVLLSF